MKNKNLVTNIIAVASSALMLVFMAMPFFAGASEYYLFQTVQYVFEIGHFDIAIIYLSPVVTLISSLLCLGFGIVNLLGVLNKIKSEKLLKASRIVVFVTSIVLLAYLVVSAIILFVREATPQIGLILLVAAAIAVLVTSIMNKKSKQA